MKVIGIVFTILILVVVGIFGYAVFTKNIPLGGFGSNQTGLVKTAPIKSQEKDTLTGTIQKASSATGDFTHIMLSSKGTKGLNSTTLNLDDYVGKSVSVEGEYSGTTLYVDNVTE